MKAEKELTKIIWNNPIDKHYSTEANIFRYGSLAIIFALAKWHFSLSTSAALIPAFAGSTLLFGLSINRIRNVAASACFTILMLGYMVCAPFFLKDQAKWSFLNPEKPLHEKPFWEHLGCIFSPFKLRTPERVFLKRHPIKSHFQCLQTLQKRFIADIS